MSDDGTPRSGGSTSSVEDTALDVLIPSDSDSSLQGARGSRTARNAGFDGGSEAVSASLLARLFALSLAYSACVVGTEAVMLWASRWLDQPIALSGAARAGWIALRLLSLGGALHLCAAPIPSAATPR